MKLTSDNSISIRTLKQVMGKTINAMVITDGHGRPAKAGEGMKAALCCQPYDRLVIADRADGGLFVPASMVRMVSGGR